VDGQILKQDILPNPYTQEGKGRGIRLAEWLKTQGADLVLTPEPLQPSGLMYALQAGGVRLEQAVSRSLADAIGSIVNKEVVS